MKHSYQNGNNYQKCAVGLMWFGDKIMLAERKGDSWGGYWAAAGGKVEPKETIVNALCREIHEETNIFVPSYAPRLENAFLDDESKQIAFLFSVSVYYARFIKVKNTEPKKRGDWQLFTKAQALRLKLIPRLRSIIRDTDPRSIVTF